MNHLIELKQAATRIREKITMDEELEGALKDLLDFAKEYYLDDEWDNSILIFRRYKECKNKDRKHGQDESSRRLISLIAEDALNLLTKIENNNKEFSEEANTTQENNSTELGMPNIKAPKNISNEVFVEGKNLSKTYDSFKLENLTLTLRSGEITAIVGENGSGKTTLLDLIGGWIKPDDGELKYLYTNSLNWYTIKEQIGYVSDSFRNWPGSLKKTLQLSAALHGHLELDNEKIVNHYIFRLGLEDEIEKKWSQLSSGYKTRFELARILIRQPKILILDEPLANLDIVTQQIILADLKDFVKSKKFPISILITSQHVHEIESIADNIIFIQKGDLLYNGSAKKINDHRSFNFFELEYAPASYDLVRYLMLLNKNITTTEMGTYTLIQAPLAITKEVALRHLLESKLSIIYFRDISKSTKIFFYGKR